MRRLAVAAVGLLLVGFVAVAQERVRPAAVADKLAVADKPAAGPMVGHMVYFKLKDATDANKKKLVAACQKYLADHDGTLFFSAGVIGDAFKRDVNDREWDVALHLVFADKAAYDKYEGHPEHLKFIDENKALWAKVRVFDSEFSDYKTGKKAK